ncbi:MAG: hypothetical protein ACXU87_24465 [Xanthobacteraceae bacterium]
MTTVVCGDVLSTVTSSAAVGTAAGFQLPAVNQSVDAVPSHDGVPARVDVVSAKLARAIEPMNKAVRDTARGPKCRGCCMRPE